VATGKELFQLVGHTACVGGVAWSSDGKRILTGGNDGGIHAAAFSPDGKRLLSGGDDKTAIVWDIESGKTVQRLEGHAGAVTSVAFLPGARRAVTCGYDKTLRLWYVRR
jgi:WD40 repeat protein